MKRLIHTPWGTVLVLVIAVLALEVWADEVLTQSVRTVSSGGGRSSAGGFELTGTVGQPLAGRITDGPHRLDSGFWHPMMAAITPVADDLPDVPVTSRLNAPYLNLGLDHCGGLDCGSIGTNSPVLASTMSYNYQLDGVKIGLLCNELIPVSAVVLYPGTFDEGGSGGVVLDQPVRLYSATSSVIK